MGSRMGYEYSYRFSMVDKDEINSVYKLHLNRGVVKAFIFEFRTNFILRIRVEEGVADAIIDSERYDARVYEDDDGLSLYFYSGYRQKEYWMNIDEMELLCNAAFAFAKQMAANPEHSSLNLIPIVVDLDVCTVQQEGESFGATMDRAIRAQNLVPLYLWPFATSVKRKPWTTGMLLGFLGDLRRIRVENINEGLALMEVCRICSRSATIGAQISLLPCRHAFHSHCIVRWLEDNNVCPSCHYPVYDLDITFGPPFMLP